MIWQDVVFTIGGWIFTAALISSLVGRDKPALLTSLVTGTVVLTFAYTYYTLQFFVSSIAMGMNGLVWYVLAFQKYVQAKGQTEIKDINKQGI